MLVSLADMKDYLGINDTSQDDWLTEQLNYISAVVEAYCRRSFEQKTVVQTFYGDANRPAHEVMLFHYPLISLTSVVQDGETLTGSRVHKPTATITRKEGYFYGEETVVTYVAGYATIPIIIQEVVKSIIQERYNRKTAGIDLSFGSDVQRISVAGVASVDFDYSLQNNEASSPYGLVIGNYANMLNDFCSERVILPSDKLEYVEVS